MKSSDVERLELLPGRLHDGVTVGEDADQPARRRTTSSAVEARPHASAAMASCDGRARATRSAATGDAELRRACSPSSSAAERPWRAAGCRSPAGRPRSCRRRRRPSRFSNRQTGQITSVVAPACYSTVQVSPPLSTAAEVARAGLLRWPSAIWSSISRVVGGALDVHGTRQPVPGSPGSPCATA